MSPTSPSPLAIWPPKDFLRDYWAEKALIDPPGTSPTTKNPLSPDELGKAWLLRKRWNRALWLTEGQTPWEQRAAEPFQRMIFKDPARADWALLVQAADQFVAGHCRSDIGLCFPAQLGGSTMSWSATPHPAGASGRISTTTTYSGCRPTDAGAGKLAKLQALASPLLEAPGPAYPGKLESSRSGFWSLATLLYITARGVGSFGNR